MSFPKELSSSQRKFLRGLAHGLKPVVLIGKAGLTDNVLRSIDQALGDHELIKIKFIEFKDEKKTLTQEIASKSGGSCVGMIGNIAIFYREHADAKKRRIEVA